MSKEFTKDESLSNCCEANMQGEPTNRIIHDNVIEGRCADCKEMTSFTLSVLVEYIEATYPLGTTDGITYTIVPRR